MDKEKQDETTTNKEPPPAKPEYFKKSQDSEKDMEKILKDSENIET
jgi:hypothetical protein